MFTISFGAQCAHSNILSICVQISSNLLVNAQDEDLLVTEFSILGQTSSGSSSTIGGNSMGTTGFESRSSTGSGGIGSTETGTFFLNTHI